jgi:protein gp37
MHPDWARSLRDQCEDAGVPFLFKQWGEYAPNWLNDDDGNKIPGSEWIDRMGKKIAGRLLDGQTWDGFPNTISTNTQK